jgi:hypothetical protein
VLFPAFANGRSLQNFEPNSLLSCVLGD